jgi:hypothetical protein
MTAELQLTTKAAVRNGAARKNAKNHLIGDGGFPGSGFMGHLLCNHIHVMKSPRDSQDDIKANSVYIKQGQLHGDTAFVAIDTEWSLANRWGYGPDGHITEFGAADAEDTVLVTDLQPPIPSAGRERTKKKRELKAAMKWVIARCPDGRPLHQYISGGGYLDGSYLGADMKGTVLTARTCGVGASTISKFADLGGANACTTSLRAASKAKGLGSSALAAPGRACACPISHHKPVPGQDLTTLTTTQQCHTASSLDSTPPSVSAIAAGSTGSPNSLPCLYWSSLLPDQGLLWLAT